MLFSVSGSKEWSCAVFSVYLKRMVLCCFQYLVEKNGLVLCVQCLVEKKEVSCCFQRLVEKKDLMLLSAQFVGSSMFCCESVNLQDIVNPPYMVLDSIAYTYMACT